MLHLVLAGLLTVFSLRPAPPRVALIQAARSASVAYYCASGNKVKYHASSSCRGLSRCSASVQKLSLAEAQQRMDACKICN